MYPSTLAQKSAQICLLFFGTLLTVLLTVFAFSSEAKEQKMPMEKLSWLLGEWTFEDAQVNGQYWERGTRTCILVLENQYIQCESKGISNSGKERSYYFILGYNSMDKRYEMLGLTSSYPRQNLYIITPSDDGHTLEISNHFWTQEGIVKSNEATIRYNGKDQYIWHIRNGELDPTTGLKKVGFIDTVNRTDK